MFLLFTKTSVIFLRCMKSSFILWFCLLIYNILIPTDFYLCELKSTAASKWKIE